MQVSFSQKRKVERCTAMPAHMIFDFPDTREQCRTTQPFCIKAYRRPTAEGAIILLKQVIASIHICGRHWGVLQMAYQDQG